MRLIYELLPELLAEKSWNVKKLSGRTVPHGHVGEKTIEAILNPRNAGRVPEAWILQSLALALGIEPEVFYEWPIAVARRDKASTAAEAAQIRERLRARLRDKGLPGDERPEADPDTTPPREHHTEQAL